jgi:hypothetical protein
LYKNFVHSRAPPRVVDDGTDDGTDDDASDRSDHQSVETIGGARTRFGFLLFRGLCARAMGDATRKRDERERFTVEFVFVARSRRVVRRFVRPTTGVRIRSIGRSDGRSSIRSDVPAATARFCARLTLRARRPS